jgi:hypothetical protein
MKAYATINWMKAWANSPRIELHNIKVPAYPAVDDPIWETDGKGLHVARKGHFVFYFYSDGKPTQGYGGREFAGTFTDGTTFEYIGAWSSRAGCINAALDREDIFGEYIVDITCGMYSTAVDLTFVEHLLGSCLSQKGNTQEFTYEPTDDNGLFKGDKGFEYPE